MPFALGSEQSRMELLLVKSGGKGKKQDRMAVQFVNDPVNNERVNSPKAGSQR